MENFFTKELKPLLYHSLRRIKNRFDFFEEKDNFLFWYFGIFTVLNHSDKISSIKEGLRNFVITAHKLKCLLDKFSDPEIRLSMFLSDLRNNFLEDKIIMRIDIETFRIYIDCFYETFLILGFL